jgi:peptide deformylase
MAILKIARMGHPVLMGISSPIEDPTALVVRQLVSDMIETMIDAPGIGLAAPQVHVPYRLVVFRVPEGRNEGEEGLPLTVLINPDIKPLTEDMEEGIEGCLSLPDMAGLVPRYTKVQCKAVDVHNNPIDLRLTGYQARVVQHECDHLDGVLYPMRMRDLSKLGYAEEMAKSNIELEASSKDRSELDD